MNNTEMDIEDYFQLTPKISSKEEVEAHAREHMDKFRDAIDEASKGHQLKSRFPKEPMKDWAREEVLTAMTPEGFTFIFDRGTGRLVDLYRLAEHCHGDNYG